MFRMFGLIAIVMTALILVPGSGSAQLVGSVKDVIDPVGSTGKVDWTTGVVTAVGIGAPPSQPANAAAARAMAERAAQVVAYRNLLEAVKGVRVDSATTVENFIVTSDVIKTQVSGIIQGATIMDKKYMSDGSVEVTVGMKLSGALAEMLLPKAPPVPPTRFGPGAWRGPGPALHRFDRGCTRAGMRPAMAPKIWNEDGKEVYGSAYINRDWAVREGMAGYVKGDPASAQSNPRVTDKPLVVKALKVSGEGRVDTVISNADAAALHSAAQNLNMLEKCKVIILVD